MKFNHRQIRSLPAWSRSPHPRGEPYEKKLSNDPRWALSEGSIFFQGKGGVQDSLRRISDRLNQLGVPYAVVGGMALFQHGVRRFTEDVDILVTRDGLKLIHEKLEGLGYVTSFAGSKNLRDTSTGVKIEFLITGAYPGDGKEKPVSFPDPGRVNWERDGIKYINLAALVELKLASGMTAPDRQKDIGDVVSLMKELNLPLTFADGLNEFVRPTYRELWARARRRYVRLWRNKFLTLEAKSIEEMAAILKAAANELAQMQADGVTLDPDGGSQDDYAMLVTDNPEIAKKYDMNDEEEYWDHDDQAEKGPDAGSVHPA